MTEKQKSRLLVSTQFILLALIFFLPTKTPDDATPRWIIDLGSFLTWPGLFIVIASIFNLGQSLTTSPIPKAESILKTDGLYRWMRHPIYTGLMVLSIGTALETASVAKLFFVAGLVVLFNYKAKWEEALLLERYPEYREYMSKTGRFVPRLNR